MTVAIDSHAGKGPRDVSVFPLFALFVVARLIIDLPERVAPAFRNFFTDDSYGFFLAYQYIDTAYLMLVVVAICLSLRRWREVLMRLDLAPLCAMLAFALLLPYLRQLLADALMTLVNLIMTGRIEEVRPFDRIISGEPLLRMITQIVLGIGAALIWYGALKWILGAHLRQVACRGIAPARRIWLLWPLLLYAGALPVLNGIGTLLFNATWRWLPYGFDLNYLIGMCILVAFLCTLRDGFSRLELSPVMIVLAFALLAELAHQLIDREILHTVRYLSNKQMPWEESLPLRLPINFVEAAIYQTVVTAIGAAAAYGILRLIFGYDLARVVKRTVPASNQLR